MNKSALEKTILEAFEDGTLAVLRTPEELKGLLAALPGAPSGMTAFLVTESDELNELAPAEALAGKVFEARVAAAAKIERGEFSDPNQNHRYTGPGYTNGVHESQQRILDLSVEERVARVLHAAEYAATMSGEG